MTIKKFQNKVEVILDALPYIRKFQDAIIVIKYGGSAMIDEELKHEVARDVSLLNYVGMKPVIIHGGGKEINKWLDKIGKKGEFSPEGLRITDDETMEVAEMVLGKIGKDIAQLLNQHGDTKAVSMSGKDAMLIKAVKYQSKYDHGHVGEVSSINVKFLKSLLEKGDIPVISSIGVGEDGSTYNINADHVASAVATALTADKLMLMTDVDGVLDGEGKLIQRINKKSIDQLIASGVITGGMIPKVKSALDVVESGVKSVHIINGTVEHSILLEILTSQGVGTMVTVDEVSG